VIGVAGPNKYIDPIIKDLTALIDAQKQVAAIVSSFITAD